VLVACSIASRGEKGDVVRIDIEVRLTLAGADADPAYQVLYALGYATLPIGPTLALAATMAGERVSLTLTGPIRMQASSTAPGVIVELANMPPFDLRPAAQFPPAAGEWWQSPGDATILVGCPRCGRYSAVFPETHRIGPKAGGAGWTLWGTPDASGEQHTASIRCPYQGCEAHGFVRELLGYRSAGALQLAIAPETLPSVAASESIEARFRAALELIRDGRHKPSGAADTAREALLAVLR